MKYLPHIAAVLVGTYLLMTLSRWLHPATFTSTTALIVLILGISAIVIDVIHNSR